MTEVSMESRFYEAVEMLPESIASVLRRVKPTCAADVQEIRLRADRPAAVFNGSMHFFLDRGGGAHVVPPGEAFVPKRAEMSEAFRALCGYSVHTHQFEIEHGYISLPGGHRAGICGSWAGDQAALRDVSSINLRVARQVRGLASPLARDLFGTGLYGVLIAGAPASGKTTLLRDLARALASGETGPYYKVAMVDERCELSAVHQGVAQNDIGLCTDLLCGCSKAVGIEIAVRTLSPELIVCDEIGRADELEAVYSGLFSGVSMVTTVHCVKPEELCRRPQARALIQTGAFEKVVFMWGGQRPGVIRDIVSTKGLL